MVAMAHPVSHAPFAREAVWPDRHPADHISSQSQGEPGRIALPSIRQVGSLAAYFLSGLRDD
jgi:hypothetical protein